MTRARYWLLGVLGAVTAIAAWWFTSSSARSLYYPPLPDVLTAVWEFWFVGEGRTHLVSSLTNLAAGLAIGIVAGIVLGLTIGQLPWLRTAITPTLEFIRAIPATALIPFMMVLLGLGSSMKIGIIALGTLFPILLNVIDGVRGISSEALDTARSFGITGWSRQWRVIVPSVLPRAAAGIKVAIPLSLILVVTSEMTGSAEGIGYILVTAQNSFNQVAVWGAIVLLGVLGVAMGAVFDAVERRLLAWDQGLNSREGTS